MTEFLVDDTLQNFDGLVAADAQSHDVSRIPFFIELKHLEPGFWFAKTIPVSKNESLQRTPFVGHLHV